MNDVESQGKQLLKQTFICEEAMFTKLKTKPLKMELSCVSKDFWVRTKESIGPKLSKPFILPNTEVNHYD